MTLFILLGNSVLLGQDAQTYQMAIPDGISLVSPGDVVISHDLTSTNQVFPDQVWQAYTSNLSGAQVEFSMGRFIHEDISFYRRNARIQLRVLASDPDANWRVTRGSARTRGFFGGGSRGTATVTAESFGPGAGQLSIRVTFIERNFLFLAAGNYNSTVVGTITNK